MVLYDLFEQKPEEVKSLYYPLTPTTTMDRILTRKEEQK